MAQTVLQEVEAGALNAIAAAITANPGVLEGIIASGESDVTAGLANLIKNIPSVKGALALIVGPLEAAVETGIEAYVASVVAKYPPAALEALIVAYIQGLAAKV